MNLYCIYIIICMPLLITILYSQCKIVSEFVLVFTPSATLVYRVRVTFFARIVLCRFRAACHCFLVPFVVLTVAPTHRLFSFISYITLLLKFRVYSRLCS